MRLFRQIDHQDLDELRAELKELAPLSEKLRAEKAAVILKQRQEAKAKLDRLEQERDATLPKLQEAIAEKQATYDAAKAALDAAIDGIRAARAAHVGKAHALERAIVKQAEFLSSTAPPEIEAGIDFFKAKLDWLRTPGRISRNAIGAEKNIAAWKKTVTAESNLAAVNGALGYCQAAIKKLDLMKLAPALDNEKIEKMKKEIPEIGVFTEYAGERLLT